ncbi:trehalose-phosphatase [Psychrobacter sp. 1U2]|uniref:trehalose-phosphatase n=1 Tax=Psychrobacter sp. 1U2 TaxID=3453577 RepID=UPI003F46B941
MTSARSVRTDSCPKYLQPEHFADYLSVRQNYALFLDLDGTLADFTLDPKDSVIPQSTIKLLQQIQSCDVKIAIVTGRSLAEAKQMLSPLKLPIAATHGLEIASHSSANNSSDISVVEESVTDVNITCVNSTELAAIKRVIVQSSYPYKDLSIENKPYSVALHFRRAPALADVAYNIMTNALKNYPSWVLKPGKYVWEIVPKGANKGAAIVTLLKRMSANDGLCPIFIGDDSTDEAGFIAVQDIYTSTGKDRKVVRGLGIKVGSGTSCAHYRVNNIYEVTVLLSSFLRFCQTYHTLSLERVGVDASLTKTVGGQ